MKLDVLVSTMYDNRELYNKMNLQGDSVIVNQTNTTSTKKINTDKGIFKFINSQDRGLSKSRNLAIMNSDADICLFSDNDVVYDTNYVETILDGYQRYPDADIIAFTVKSTSEIRGTNALNTGRVNRIMSMKISSVQISFKREIIEKYNLYLNEKFGAGSECFNSGEENIFLYNAIKKGLKVYYIDEKIAEVSYEESTWHGKDDKKDLLTKGAMFYTMSKIGYPFYNLQFAIRKHSEYKKSYSLIKMIKILFKGSKMIKQ